MASGSKGTRAPNDRSIVADALMGAVAGAAAVWVMDRVDWFMFEHEDSKARRQTQAVRPDGKDPAHVTAGMAAHAMGKEFSNPQYNPAGLAIHYNLGIGPGALYGVLCDRVPGIGTGRGLLYGLGLLLIEDEGLNAALGLSARQSQYPWQAHARGFITHLVYGFSLDAGVRALNKAADAFKSHQRDLEQTAPEEEEYADWQSGYRPPVSASPAFEART